MSISTCFCSFADRRISQDLANEIVLPGPSRGYPPHTYGSPRRSAGPWRSPEGSPPTASSDHARSGRGRDSRCRQSRTTFAGRGSRPRRCSPDELTEFTESCIGPRAMPLGSPSAAPSCVALLLAVCKHSCVRPRCRHHPRRVTCRQEAARHRGGGAERPRSEPLAERSGCSSGLRGAPVRRHPQSFRSSGRPSR